MRHVLHFPAFEKTLVCTPFSCTFHVFALDGHFEHFVRFCFPLRDVSVCINCSEPPLFVVSNINTCTYVSELILYPFHTRFQDPHRRGLLPMGTPKVVE